MLHVLQLLVVADYVYYTYYRCLWLLIVYATDTHCCTCCRCLWLLIVLGMAGWLVFTLSSLYTRYKSYPYTTSYSVNQLNTLPLPAISLCLRNPIQRSRLRHLPHSDIIEDILMRRRWDFGNKTFRSILSRFTMQDVMEAGSFRADEIILQASVTSKRIDVKLNFTTWDAPFGVLGHPVRCFTFNAMDRCVLYRHGQVYVL